MALDSFLVTMGIKGQDVVLSTMDKVQKKGDALSKPILNNIQMKTRSTSGKVVKPQDTNPAENTKENNFEKSSKVINDTPKGAKESFSEKSSKVINDAPKGVKESFSEKPNKDVNDTSKGFKDLAKNLNDGDKKLKQYTKDVSKASKDQKKLSKEDRDNKKESALSKYATGAVGSASQVGHGVVSMDTGAVVGGVSSLLAKAGLVGVVVGAAANLLNAGSKAGPELARTSSKEAYALSTRSSTARYYGGGNVNKGIMSYGEHAQLVSDVSGVFGRIQKPLAAQINRLSPSKDTGALSRVAGGNWRSTGTDKGYFLQKLSDSFGDLPPSIAQKFQASLLSKYGGEIQDKGGVQAQAQGLNTKYSDRAETHAMNLFDISSKRAKEMNALDQRNYNDQYRMAQAMVGLSGAIEDFNGVMDSVSNGVSKASAAVEDFGSATAAEAKSIWRRVTGGSPAPTTGRLHK